MYKSCPPARRETTVSEVWQHACAARSFVTKATAEVIHQHSNVNHSQDLPVGQQEMGWLLGQRRTTSLYENAIQQERFISTDLGLAFGQLPAHWTGSVSPGGR